MDVDILLSTINARYIHSAFGLRYLMANLGPLQERAQVIEWTIKDQPTRMMEDVMERMPRILGVGVYIWNLEVATRFVTAIKRLLPELIVVLGGPEVSYEWQELEIVEAADYLVTGEADLAFARLCEQILAGTPPPTSVITSPLPSVPSLAMPYSFYKDEDLAHRVIYVELSRGCPFQCEFCLSSLDIPVRKFEIKAFLHEMERLYQAGVQQFKFVDRTFNLNIRLSQQILDFFYERMRPGLFLHFEMIPDRFPEALRESVKRFPPGSLQFEVGIQTFNEEVAERINRKQDNTKIDENLQFLREQTGVHVHADLIVGLPGEDLRSFGKGFDHLLSLRPQEIQVGILKRLRGTPIARHSEEWEMLFNPNPPYEIMQTQQVDFAEIQQMKRFSQLWDRYANSGNFVNTLPLLWTEKSPFESFWAFSLWVVGRLGKSHSISLTRLMEQLFVYLTEQKGADQRELAVLLWEDYTRGGSLKIPSFLKPYLDLKAIAAQRKNNAKAPARQARHMGT